MPYAVDPAPPRRDDARRPGAGAAARTGRRRRSTSAPDGARSRSLDGRPDALDVAARVVAVLLVVLSALAGGGYFPSQHLLVGIGSLVAAAVLIVLRGAPPHLTRRGGLALGALLLGAAWIGLSAAWSPEPAGAWEALYRQVSYAGVLVFAIVALGRAHGAPGMVAAVWGALTVVAVLGVASRLLPGLELAALREPDFGGYRLSWPVEYWNGQGALSAMAIVLALALAVDRRSPAALRALAAASVPLVTLGLVLAVSRGSVLALGVGLLVLVGLSRRRLHAVLVVLAAGVPAAAAVALAAAEPAIVDDPTARPALADVGPRVLGEAVALGLLAGVLVVVLLRWLVRREARAAARTRGPGPVARWLPAVALGGAVVVLAGLLVVAGRLDGPAAGSASGARGFVETQRRAFLEATPTTDAGLSRLATANGSRSDLYRVAWDAFGDAPLVGQGAGSFPARWLRERRTPQPVENAHSLPLETLAETGAVGFLLLAVLVGAVVRGAVLARRRPSALPRAVSAGVSAALAVFAVSCAIDWTWQLGTVTAAALLLAATLLVDRRSRLASGTARRPVDDG